VQGDPGAGGPAQRLGPAQVVGKVLIEVSAE
jgi:hypothetical protein